MSSSIYFKDMFDRCLEIHKKIGCTGIAGMEFYLNISRPIIDIFLKYIEEYRC